MTSGARPAVPGHAAPAAASQEPRRGLGAQSSPSRLPAAPLLGHRLQPRVQPPSKVHRVTSAQTPPTEQGRVNRRAGWCSAALPRFLAALAPSRVRDPSSSKGLTAPWAHRRRSGGSLHQQVDALLLGGTGELPRCPSEGPAQDCRRLCEPAAQGRGGSARLLQ